jgi:hypothetical protein
MTIGGGLTTASGTASLEPIGSSTMYTLGSRNLFIYNDNFQLIKSKHQFSFGVLAQRLQDNRRGASRQAGQAIFSTLQTFLQGTVSNFVGVPNPTFVGYRMTMGAWYAEDNITLRRSFYEK